MGVKTAIVLGVGGAAATVGFGVSAYVDGGAEGLGFYMGSLIPGLVSFGGGVWAGARHAAKTYCFVAGTLIATTHGLAPIESVNPGDTVWAFDEHSGAIVASDVIAAVERLSDHLVVVYTEDEVVQTTDEHPFQTWPEGWKKAGELASGDLLVTAQGLLVPVHKVERVDGSFFVYNIEVEDAHNYFVTEQDLLVHNKKIVDYFKNNWRFGQGCYDCGNSAWQCPVGYDRRDA
ncbi:MAG: Hint domain-containing protein [Bradymonadaceae bacterium]